MNWETFPLEKKLNLIGQVFCIIGSSLVVFASIWGSEHLWGDPISYRGPEKKTVPPQQGGNRYSEEEYFR